MSIYQLFRFSERHSVNAGFSRQMGHFCMPIHTILAVYYAYMNFIISFKAQKTMLKTNYNEIINSFNERFKGKKTMDL